MSIALAPSLPENNYKPIITAMVFGVVLISLIIQADVLNSHLRSENKARKLQ